VATASGSGAAASSASLTRKSSKKSRKQRADKPAHEDLPVFPYDQLKQVKSLPKGVNRKKLEWHLSDEEFEQVMGCDKGTYASMAGFQQLRLKMKAGLL